jgi:hypothetical protein
MFLMGDTEKANIGDSIPAAIPNISGTFSGVGQKYSSNGATLSGAFYRINTANKPKEGVKLTNDGGAEKDDYFGFDARRCSDVCSGVYSNVCDTVQPPAIKTIWCIQHTSTATPAICMPKVNYKKVKIFRHFMNAANHAFTFDKIIDTISEPKLNEELLNTNWNDYLTKNPDGTVTGETTFIADDNYFMEIMARNMVTLAGSHGVNIIINGQPMLYAVNYGECAGFTYLISKNDKISISRYTSVKCLYCS